MKTYHKFPTPQHPKKWCLQLLFLFFIPAVLLSGISIFFITEEFVYYRNFYATLRKASAKNKPLHLKKKPTSSWVLYSEIQYTNIPAQAIFGSSHMDSLHIEAAKTFKLFSQSAISTQHFNKILDCMIFYHGKIPNRILLEIGPWCFNKKRTAHSLSVPSFYNTRYRTLPLLEMIHDIAHIIDSVPRKITETSLNDIFSIVTTSRDIETNNKTSLQPDNQEKLGEENSLKHKSLLEGKNMNCGSLYSAIFEHFDNIDSNAVRALLKKVTELGSIPTVYLTPYNPVFIDFMKAKNKGHLLTRIEQACREICKEMNIQVIGSYDPEKAGNFTQDDFYDRDHFKSHVHKKLLTEFFTQEKI